MESIIVSGAGSGIGRAIACDLAARNDVRLILVGRRAQRLEQVCSELPRPDTHILVPVSVSYQHEMRKAFQEIDLINQNLVGVIANAGIGGENHYGADDRWDDIIRTNLTGTYTFINECLPAIKKSQGTRQIVIVSSILARLGVPGYTAYCASKAGLLGLMRSLAVEYASQGIMVNAVCPGWVNTEMAREGIRQFAQHLAITYEEALAKQMSVVPTGKMSEPEEIASLVSYLLSGKQSSVTGQTLDMNNGALMP